jgi:cytochrome P450
MIHLLHRHPETLQRAQAEVRALLPADGEPTLEQLDSLSYLDACAMETMRLKPVAPFMPVTVVNETVIGDVRVPAGGNVWCVLRHDSLSDTHFPEAHAFRPERWLTAESDAQAHSSAKRVAMPFGAGPRVCPGRYLALLEMKMAMATLLQHFEIQSVEAPSGREAEELMAFTMSPIGLRMRLKLRAQTA